MSRIEQLQKLVQMDPDDALDIAEKVFDYAAQTA